MFSPLAEDDTKSLMETERRRRQNDGEGRHSLFLLLSGSADLRLGRTANLLLPVFQFLDLLSSGLFLFDDSMSGQSVLGLVFFGTIHVVVDKGETDGFVAAEEGVESESKNHVRRRLVHLRELISDLGFGHRGASRMQDVDDICFLFKSRFVMNLRVRTVIAPFSAILLFLTVYPNKTEFKQIETTQL